MLWLCTDLGRNDAELSASGARILHLPPCRHQHLNGEEWARVRVRVSVKHLHREKWVRIRIRVRVRVRSTLNGEE